MSRIKEAFGGIVTGGIFLYMGMTILRAPTAGGLVASFTGDIGGAFALAGGLGILVGVLIMLGELRG